MRSADLIDEAAQKPLTACEKVNIAIAMTWAAGFVDLVGYESLYGLYTAHMTGNTVAMARHISALQLSGVVRRGWPILMFVGLMLGAVIYEGEKRHKVTVPFPSAILLETLLVGIFIAAGSGDGAESYIPPQPATKFFAMVALLAIAMGIQNVVIRKVGGINVYTTFVTGSLVKFAEMFSQYLFWIHDRTRQRFRRRILKVLRISPRTLTFKRAALTLGLWIAYLVGAVCGGISLKEWALRGMIAPSVILFAVALYGAVRPFHPLSNNEW